MVSADSPTWNWILIYSGTIGGGMDLKAGIAVRQKRDSIEEEQLK